MSLKFQIEDVKSPEGPFTHRVIVFGDADEIVEIYESTLDGCFRFMRDIIEQVGG